MSERPVPGFRRALIIAIESYEDRLVDAERRSISNYRFNLRFANCLHAGRIKDELLDLASGDQPVGAQMTDEELSRAWRNGQAVAFHLLIDDELELFRCVGIAFNRRAPRVSRDCLAKRRIGLDVSGSDNDGAVGWRVLHERFKDLREGFGPGIDPDASASAEESYRVGFVRKLLRVRGNGVAVQPKDLKRIPGVFD